MERMVDSSTSLLFTFTRSRGAKVSFQEFPFRDQGSFKARAALNISGDTRLLPQGKVPSGHQSPHWVPASVQQSQETWRQRRTPLPAR